MSAGAGEPGVVLAPPLPWAWLARAEARLPLPVGKEANVFRQPPVFLGGGGGWRVVGRPARGAVRVGLGGPVDSRGWVVGGLWLLVPRVLRPLGPGGLLCSGGPCPSGPGGPGVVGVVGSGQG